LQSAVGLGFRESPDDEWPAIVDKIKASDVVLFATPIWWSSRGSLIQRVIERLDALDEEYHSSGRSALYNKVGGVVITGSEDGALNTMGSIMMVLTWMGLYFAARMRGLLGWRSGLPSGRRSRKKTKEPGRKKYGQKYGTQPCVLCTASKGAPTPDEGLARVE
jgi:multimeric flavodoxin WrbA